MSPADVVAALALPESARVGQRVPKKLLTEHGAPTTADRRRISDGVDDLQWIATLKPTTIGVPAYRDEEREYLEIAILSVTLRAGAKEGRLAELIHRAIPYPVLLITSLGTRTGMSLAHKRHSQGAAGEIVLDGELAMVELGAGETPDVQTAFRESLALTRQSHGDLRALYQGWIDALVALQAARVGGSFHFPGDADAARRRRDALRECEVLDAGIARLRAAAARERQVPRQVALNLELRRLERQRSAAIQNL